MRSVTVSTLRSGYKRESVGTTNLFIPKHASDTSDPRVVGESVFRVVCYTIKRTFQAPTSVGAFMAGGTRLRCEPPQKKSAHCAPGAAWSGQRLCFPQAASALEQEQVAALVSSVRHRPQCEAFAMGQDDRSFRVLSQDWCKWFCVNG